MIYNKDAHAHNNKGQKEYVYNDLKIDISGVATLGT